MKLYTDWLKALRVAWLQATASGLKHRVSAVPPTNGCPVARWRIEPLSDPTPAATFDLLTGAGDVVLTPPESGRGPWVAQALA